MKKKVVIGLLIALSIGVSKINESLPWGNLQNGFIGNIEYPRIEETVKIKTTSDFLQEIEDFKQEQIRKQKEMEEKKREEQRKRDILSRGSVATEITIEASAYCSCPLCCGSYSYTNHGITASGTRAKWGTIAVPKEMKFGTKMKIEGFGNQTFTAEDRGGYIKKIGNVYRIDIYMSSHAETQRFGRRKLKAWIVN